jgi:hypothetical protein
MRIHRHDVRDLALAFGLAFDLRRVTQAGVALCWTLIVLLGITGILSWRVSGGQWMSAEGLLGAWLAITGSGWSPADLLLWGCSFAGWLAGFLYLCAPVLRSAALDVCRDERERNPSIPALNRQAGFSPLLMLLLPALCFLLVLLWSLLTFIPGVAGAMTSALALIPVMPVALFGAAFLLVSVLAAPMMPPTAVVEGRDYLETVSRPVSYVMQRPGRYFAYWTAKLGMVAASALAGCVVLALAWGMVAGALWLVGQGELVHGAWLQATLSGDPELHVAPVAFGLAVGAWSTLFLLLAWLVVVSLSADLLIYLLMRYQVDGVTFDKITVAEERVQALKTAVETAEEAEQARQRFDAAQARDPAPTA